MVLLYTVDKILPGKQPGGTISTLIGPVLGSVRVSCPTRGSLRFTSAMADEDAGRRSKRARRATEVMPNAGGGCAPPRAPPPAAASRPTPAEEQEALEVIRIMKLPSWDPPMLHKRAPAKSNVVACAIAMSRGERFNSDAKALKLFGVAPDTKVRREWVDGKLARLAPAGLGTPGEPALPVYLLDRGETSAEQPAASSSSGSGSSDEGSDEDEERRQERRQERRENRWSSSGAAQDARWQREQDAAKALRVQEAAKWDATHGAEREAQHATLTAERPDVYWALAHEIGRRPKWQLRKGAHLEADATRGMAHDEPSPLYRAFRPFDGNVVKALSVLSGPLLDPDLIVWLDSERANLPGWRIGGGATVASALH